MADRDQTVRKNASQGTTRRQFLRRAGAVLAAPAAVKWLGAPAQAFAAPRRLVRLKVAEPGPLLSVDAQGQTGEIRAIFAFAQGLVAANSSGQIVPWLADQWRISGDGLQYTFTLRKNVKFHNGDPFTAEDVKWSLERQMDPQTRSRHQGDLRNVDSIRVVDRNTMVITLKQPFAPFLASLPDTFILSPKSERNAQGLVTKPIGTGPFKFVDWVPDRSLLLERFADYWEPGIPKVDELEVLPIPDGSTRLSALEAGNIHAMIGYPASQVSAAAIRPGVRFMLGTAPRWWAYAFNLRSLQPPFNNRNVRRAIAMAVDKAAVQRLFTFGLGRPTAEFYSPDQFWYTGIKDPYAKPSLDKARELLATERVPQGQPIRLIAPNTFDIDRFVLILEDQLKSIGFNPTTQISDYTSFTTRLRNADAWDMAGQGISYKLDPSVNFSFLDPNSSIAYFVGGGWSNEQFVRLLRDAATKPDPKIRKELYGKAYEMMLDEVPVLLTVYDRQIWGHRVQLKGWKAGLGDYHSPDSGFGRATLEE